MDRKNVWIPLRVWIVACKVAQELLNARKEEDNEAMAVAEAVPAPCDGASPVYPRSRD
jgi:hypothetical protein